MFYNPPFICSEEKLVNQRVCLEMYSKHIYVENRMFFWCFLNCFNKLILKINFKNNILVNIIAITITIIINDINHILKSYLLS